jgi:chromosome segregation ATPase
VFTFSPQRDDEKTETGRLVEALMSLQAENVDMLCELERANDRNAQLEAAHAALLRDLERANDRNAQLEAAHAALLRDFEVWHSHALDCDERFEMLMSEMSRQHGVATR